MQTFIGIDLGTSGCRGAMIDADGKQQAFARTELPSPVRDGPRVTQEARYWWDAVDQMMGKLCALVPGAEVHALAVDGTSGTLLHIDTQGAPLGPALMYNDQRAVEQARQVAGVAPDDCGAHGPSSSIAKLLYLTAQSPQRSDALPCHQADWIVGQLCGDYRISDEHNALKLGFDPRQGAWPAWLKELGVPMGKLPQVAPPGRPVGTLRAELARRWGLSQSVRVVAGTTDSTAGVLATGAHRLGQAVTSLGSTLVMKVLSPQPLFSAKLGVYSHRLGNIWLAGGASNSGGAVLEKYFSAPDLERLTAALLPDRETGLDYYPLLHPGERFPDPDPELPPRLEPRPASDAKFMQGMLEGMACIECRGYQVLQAFGAPYPTSVLTVGGGSRNQAWTAIRARTLGVPVTMSSQQEAAYGTALLARQGVLGSPCTRKSMGIKGVGPTMVG